MISIERLPPEYALLPSTSLSLIAGIQKEWDNLQIIEEDDL